MAYDSQTPVFEHEVSGGPVDDEQAAAALSGEQDIQVDQDQVLVEDGEETT